MIHATWRKDLSTGRWGVFIEKDKAWGKEEPQPFDKVLVQARSGEVKEVQIECAHAELGGWFCPLVDRNTIGVATDGYDYWGDPFDDPRIDNPHGDPYGGFWDDPLPFDF